MENKDHIIFKSEDSIWRTLEDGSKKFDYRRYDLADERIYRLSWGRRDGWGDGLGIIWNEDFVSFLNKDTGEFLTFHYCGMEFVPWAPGWCFLLLGHRV